VEKGERLINMDAQAPNKVFGEFIGRFAPDALSVRPEYRYGGSRLDFCLETSQGRHLVEVKGVTLEENGHARFPDAPTERGLKHVRELTRLVGEGYRCVVCFIVHMERADSFSPDYPIHEEFGKALEEAAEAGVEVLAFTCRTTPDTLELADPVPVVFRRILS
jgi:sugar fermentation stimulation protein A